MQDDEARARAQQRAIEPHIPGLRRYAWSVLRDGPAADDAVQDCLLRALDRWHQHRPESSTRAWLFAILRSVMTDRFRKWRRRGIEVAMDDARAELFAIPATQEAQLYQAEVLQAVGLLPQGPREVLLLVTVEGLTYEEAAIALDLPVGTVMSRLSRGRDMLRERLKERSVPVGREARLRRVK